MTTRSPGEDGVTRSRVLLDRMYEGDSAARDELLGRLYQRLVRLASVIQGDFPILKGHQPESIFHNTWQRLARALDKERPATVADFFGLAAHKIRQVLLDMAEHERRRGGVGHAVGTDPTASTAPPPAGLEDSTYDPDRLAFWTELHHKVEELPPAERQVFTLRYYAGLNQAEVATALNIHPRQVSRLWLGATMRLAKALPGFRDLL